MPLSLADISTALDYDAELPVEEYSLYLENYRNRQIHLPRRINTEGLSTSAGYDLGNVVSMSRCFPGELIS